MTTFGGLMKKALASLIFAAGAFSYGQAQAIQVLGAVDCGKWLAGKSDAYSWWLAGFMSGMALKEYRDGTDPLAGVSAEQLDAWMDKYCRENPLSWVSAGGIKLLKELKERR